MTLRSKITTIAILWACIGASAYWGTQIIYVRILLLLIAIGVTWHLAAIKTAVPESLSNKMGNNNNDDPER